MHCRQLLAVSAVLTLLLTATALSQADVPLPTTAAVAPIDTPLAPGLKMQDVTTIDAPMNLLTFASATNADGTVNAVVEIPTGTNAKSWPKAVCSPPTTPSM